MDRREQRREREVRLATEQIERCLGTAKVKLSELHFGTEPSLRPDPRELHNVREKFRRICLLRLNPENRVKAIVSHQNLDRSLQRAGVSANSLRDPNPDNYPFLHFPNKELTCLHGRYRVEVGRTLLPPHDQWWTVDLYPPDISQELRNTLKEEYANEVAPTDGEIYVKIRHYQVAGDVESEDKWWGRLSPNKASNVCALLNHRSLSAAFNSLCDIPGLWTGVHLGVIRKIKALHCDEEIIHYLREIRKFWGSLVEFRPERMAKIDRKTVEALQGLAPGVSSEDRESIDGLISSGQIFRGFSEEERNSIWDKIQKFKRLIPSLFTFFQDVHILERCAQHVLKLLDQPMQPTIRLTMEFMFESDGHHNGEYPIQVSEENDRQITCDSRLRLELGYRQVWLYAIRHFVRGNKIGRKKRGTRNSSNIQVDERVSFYRMAVLARNLRFRSDSINNVVSRAPPDGVNEQTQPRPVNGYLAAIYPEMRNRYGIPDVETFKEDRKFLFLDQMHMVPEECERITTFFVLQSVYLTFFGLLPSPIPSGPASGTEGTAGTTLGAGNEASGNPPSGAETNIRENETLETGDEASGDPPPVAETGTRDETQGAVPERATSPMSGIEAAVHESPERETEATERTTLDYASGMGMGNIVDSPLRANTEAAPAPSFPNRPGISDDATPTIEDTIGETTEPVPETTAMPETGLNCNEWYQELELLSKKWSDLVPIFEDQKQQTEELLRQVNSQLEELSELGQQEYLEVALCAPALPAKL
ncbi:hypothetical protein VTN00DRAFT_9616 [Thermoascus crustaceus]|uniref:uncharacterized protein n=1 Tax=Thermoascus crustaceus TaxID=5088 RepID=UPI00374479C2